MKQNQWQKAFPEVPQSFRQRTAATLSALPSEEENKKMKLKKRFAIPVIALVATLCIGTGLMATGNVTALIGCSNAWDDYTELPTAAEVGKEIGVEPILPANIGDYAFSGGTIVKNRGEDPEGNTVIKYKSLSCKYVGSKGSLTYVVYPYHEVLASDREPCGEVKGIPLYDGSYVSKNVPAGYEMTPQDKADEEAGKYIFNEGEVDAVTETAVVSLSWQQDGVEYLLMSLDGSIPIEKMKEFAAEIIR